MTQRTLALMAEEAAPKKGRRDSKVRVIDVGVNGVRGLLVRAQAPHYRKIVRW